MKDVWIFNHYAANMYLDENGRHYAYAKYLVKQGYKITIFSANTIHGKNNELHVENDFILKEKEGIQFVFIKCPRYHSNSLKRIQNMYTYYSKLKKIYKVFPKPNLIIGSQVHPLACLAAIQISKKVDCKCITEYRDLWPISIVEYSKVTERNILIKFLYRLEKYLYLKSDGIIFTMPGGIDYLKEQAYSNKVNYRYVYYLNNGVDLDIFNYNKVHFKIEDSELVNDEFRITYTGSLRSVNGIEFILDILSKLDFEYTCFLYGYLDNTEIFIKEIKKRGLMNKVYYKGEIKKNEVPYVLAASSLNIIYWSSAEITKRGISANKVFDYLAAGKPIISNNQEKYDFIEKNHAGFSSSIKSLEDYAASITEIYKLSPNERRNMGENARLLAKEFDYKEMAKKLDIIIQEVLRRN